MTIFFGRRSPNNLDFTVPFFGRRRLKYLNASLQLKWKLSPNETEASVQWTGSFINWAPVYVYNGRCRPNKFEASVRLKWALASLWNRHWRPFEVDAPVHLNRKPSSIWCASSVKVGLVWEIGVGCLWEKRQIDGSLLDVGPSVTDRFSIIGHYKWSPTLEIRRFEHSRTASWLSLPDPQIYQLSWSRRLGGAMRINVKMRKTTTSISKVNVN